MIAPTLEETAHILCEPVSLCSEFERAILLFGLQVAAISPTVPNLARDARLHVAMKILEHIERGQVSSAKMGLLERLSLPNYEKIVGQMLARDGSWGAIARTWTRKDFATDIEARWIEARDAGRLVEFSSRFARFRSGDRRKAGVTMAHHFVCKTTNISDGTMKTRRRQYGQTAVLSYLLREIGPRPAKLSTKKFIDTLLSQVNDIEGLRRLFAAYRNLSKVLRPRGYTCDEIVLHSSPKIMPSIDLKDFSAEESQVIDSYRS